MSDTPQPGQPETEDQEHPKPAPDPDTTSPAVHPDDGSHTPPQGDEFEGSPHHHGD